MRLFVSHELVETFEDYVFRDKNADYQFFSKYSEHGIVILFKMIKRFVFTCHIMKIILGTYFFEKILLE